MLSKIRKSIDLIGSFFKRDPDRFLKEVRGVVHVGANAGQERMIYESRKVSVVWIEPIPQVFSQLLANIKAFERQIAFQALITDIDDQEYEFKIANNNGASSSIFDFERHSEVWPSVKFLDVLILKSVTLSTFFEREQIDVGKFDALVLDTQGSELLVLKGAVSILHNFKFIKTEVPDFESYKGCCTLLDISLFMERSGYMEFSRKKFASRKGIGNYFDVVYKKR